MTLQRTISHSIMAKYDIVHVSLLPLGARIAPYEMLKLRSFSEIIMSALPSPKQAVVPAQGHHKVSQGHRENSKHIKTRNESL